MSILGFKIRTSKGSGGPHSEVLDTMPSTIDNASIKLNLGIPRSPELFWGFETMNKTSLSNYCNSPF